MSEPTPSGTTVESAEHAVGLVVEQTKAAVGSAREHAASMVGSAKQSVHEQLEQRAQQAGGGLRTFADQLRSLQQGDTAGAGPLGHYLEEARERVSTMADRFEQGGAQGLLQDARGAARRRPGAFLAAAVGAGFVAGRLVRAGIAATHDDTDGSGARGAMTGDSMAAGSMDGDPMAAGSMGGDGTPVEAEALA